MCAWRLLLLAALPALVGVGARRVAQTGPSFLPTRRALSTVAGEEAVLTCIVSGLGDKAVSWVRARDLHILAHNGVVFSADPRIAAGVRKERGIVSHLLRIAPLKQADGGQYECQLNTDPKLSQFFNLTVLSRAWRGVIVRPLGATRVFAARGSTATLGCVAQLRPMETPDPPQLKVTWYQDEQQLLPLEGGIALDTEREAGVVTSRLTLAALMPTDSGRYICRVTADIDEEQDAGLSLKPESLRGEANFTLLITDSIGENIEAMQRDQSPLTGIANMYRAAPMLAALAVAVALAMH